MHADYVIVQLDDLKYLGILRDLWSFGNIGNIDDKH